MTSNGYGLEDQVPMTWRELSIALGEEPGVMAAAGDIHQREPSEEEAEDISLALDSAVEATRENLENLAKSWVQKGQKPPWEV
jgi:hypothetical protein